MALLGNRLSGKLGMLPSFAAAMAFYSLTSLVPFLVVLSWAVAALFKANLTPEIARFLNSVLPPESGLRPDSIVESVQQTPMKALGPASLLVAVWTASSWLNEMARAIHYLFSDPGRPDLGGFFRWLKALALLALWTLGLSGAAVLLVLLPAVEQRLIQLGAKPALAGLVGAWARYPLAAGLLFLAFFLSYVLVPTHHVRRGAALGGAVIATGWWIATCALFAHLLPTVWHVSLFHGALGSALALLVWAYCGAWGVIAGASVAARLDEA